MKYKNKYINILLLLILSINISCISNPENQRSNYNPEPLDANIPSGINIDNDGDGFTPADGDCDDSNSSIYPGVYDTPLDGVDQNCDGYDETWGKVGFYEFFLQDGTYNHADTTKIKGMTIVSDQIYFIEDVSSSIKIATFNLTSSSWLPKYNDTSALYSGTIGSPDLTNLKGITIAEGSILLATDSSYWILESGETSWNQYPWPAPTDPNMPSTLSNIKGAFYLNTTSLGRKICLLQDQNNIFCLDIDTSIWSKRTLNIPGVNAPINFNNIVATEAIGDHIYFIDQNNIYYIHTDYF